MIETDPEKYAPCFSEDVFGGFFPTHLSTQLLNLVQRFDNNCIAHLTHFHRKNS